MIGWLKPKEAAHYCGVSVRTLRSWLKSDGLKHSRIRGSILIKIQWIDEFLEQFKIDDNQVDDIVSEVCKELEI